MMSLRALLRIAWRDASRHRARTLMAALLIALPVALIVTGASAIDALREGTDASAKRVMGQAAARAEGGDLTALARLDASYEVLAAGEESVDALSARFVELDPDARLDRLAHGLVDLVDGAPPHASGEVGLSTWLASALGVTTGDVVTLHDGPARVTGLVQDDGQLDLALVVRVAPRNAPPFGAPFALVDRAPPAVIADLHAAGFGVTQRSHVVIEHDAFESSVLFALATLAAFLVALTLGATFASQLPRRQERIALLASTGASPAALFGAELVGALALAASACALGALIGSALALGVAPTLATWAQKVAAPFRFPFVHFAGAWLLVSVTTVSVLALPTWKTTRRTRRHAAPRVHPARTRVAWTCLALGALLVLLAWTSEGGLTPLAALAGAALWIVGTLLAIPAVLSAVANRAARLPLAWRLAVRDTSRLRDRYTPVVAGVTACMTLVALIAVFGRSVESLLATAAPRAPLAADQLMFRGPAAASLASELAGSPDHRASGPLLAAAIGGAPLVARIDTPSLDAFPQDGWIAVGDAALFDALGAANVSAELVAWATDDTPSVVINAGGLQLEALAVPRAPLADGPLVVASQAFANAQGWSIAPPPSAALTPHVVRMNAPISRDLQRRLELRAEQLGTRVSSMRTTGGPRVRFDGALVIVTLVVAIAVIALAAGLTLVESQQDAARLHALGAAPATLTAIHASRACYLALVGCVLALPAASLPLLALLRLGDISIDISIPWTRLVAALLGLPLLAALGARAFAPRHASAAVTTPNS